MDYLDIVIFSGVVISLLTFDLASRPHEEVSLRASINWVIFYIVMSLLFAGYIYTRMGPESAMLFLTGWGLEKALAVDNLMVFIAIFAYFKVPASAHHRILYLGIIGAIVLRLIFVTVGVGFMDSMGGIAEIVFGIIILYTAYLMFTAGEDEDVNYDKTWYIQGAKKLFKTTSSVDGDKLFLDGYATRYFFALIAIELSDIMFSFDSVPVIIAVTKDPFLIYTAMIMAILGLRSMYFVLAHLHQSLKYFEYAVIVVLVVVACKMFASAIYDIHITPLINLAVIGGILTTGVLFSLPHKEKSK